MKKIYQQVSYNSLKRAISYSKVLIARTNIEKLKYEVGYFNVDIMNKNIHEIIGQIIKEFAELKCDKNMNNLAFKLINCMEDQKEIALTDSDILGITDLLEYMGKMAAIEELRHLKNYNLTEEIKTTGEELINLVKENGLMELFSSDTIERLERNNYFSFLLSEDITKIKSQGDY